MFNRCYERSVHHHQTVVSTILLEIRRKKSESIKQKGWNRDRGSQSTLAPRREGSAAAASSNGARNCSRSIAGEQTRQPNWIRSLANGSIPCSLRLQLDARSHLGKWITFPTRSKSRSTKSVYCICFNVNPWAAFSWSLSKKKKDSVENNPF